MRLYKEKEPILGTRGEGCLFLEVVHFARHFMRDTPSKSILAILREEWTRASHKTFSCLQRLVKQLLFPLSGFCRRIFFNYFTVNTLFHSHICAKAKFPCNSLSSLPKKTWSQCWVPAASAERDVCSCKSWNSAIWNCSQWEAPPPPLSCCAFLCNLCQCKTVV